jgi:hypothetical protein
MILHLLQKKLTDRIASLLPEGFSFDPDSPAGGCRITAPDGRILSITDGEDEPPFTDPDMPDVVFSYFTDGEPDGELILETHGADPSAVFWDGIDVSVKAWVDSDPYREI